MRVRPKFKFRLSFRSLGYIRFRARFGCRIRVNVSFRISIRDWDTLGSVTVRIRIRVRHRVRVTLKV